MDRRPNLRGGKNRDRYALAAVAAAGLLGVIIGDVKFGHEAPNKLPRAGVAETVPLTIEQRLISIRNRIEALGANGASGVSSLRDEQAEYLTSATARRDHSGQIVYDQLVLIMSTGEAAPDRVLLNTGADRQAYTPGTQASSWLEMDKQGEKRYGVIGYDSASDKRQSRQSFAEIETFMYEAEAQLEMAEEPNSNPRLKA